MAGAERSENQELSLVDVGKGRTRATSRMSPGVLVHTAGQRVVPHAQMGTPESHPHSRMEAGFYQGQDPSCTGTRGPETEVRVLWTRLEVRRRHWAPSRARVQEEWEMPTFGLMPTSSVPFRGKNDIGAGMWGNFPRGSWELGKPPPSCLVLWLFLLPHSVLAKSLKRRTTLPIG